MAQAGAPLSDISGVNETSAPKTETTADKANCTDSNLSAKVDYKIVKVRKPDGTIVKVRRPVPSAATAENESKTTGQSSQTTPPAQKAKTAESTAQASQTPGTPGGSPKTEIVSFKKPDGTIGKARRVIPAAESKQGNEPKKDVPTSSKETASPDLTPPVAPSQPAAAPSKPSVQGSAQKAPEAGITPAQASTAYAVFRGLNRLHHHSSKVIGAFVPDWDIGEFEDGDEPISDNDNDSDDEEDYSENEEDHKRSDDRSSQHTVENEKAVGGAGHTIAGALPPAYTAAQKAAPTTSQRSPGIQANPQEPANTVTNRKPEPNVQEKGMAHGGDVEDAKPPARTRTLTNSQYADWARYLMWAITIILPLLFIILGIMTAAIRGKPENDKTGRRVTEALIIAISAWPIIFAAIAAQSLRALATYKVERGIRLMTLEQLISSNSVASSIKQPFILRRLNWVTLALLCLWGLSPLASQAMQRVSNTAGGATNSSMSFAYVNTYQKNLAFSLLSNYVPDQDYIPNLNRYYSAAFLPSASFTNAQDTWANPRIPIFEKLPADVKVDGDGWHVLTDSMYEDLKYSSLFGIPIASFYTQTFDDIPTTDHEFVIRSAYLNFDCQSLEATTMDVINSTGVTLHSTQSGTLFLDLVPTQSTGPPTNLAENVPGNLTFASLISNNDSTLANTTFAYSVCTFNQSFVDSKVHCSDGDCQVIGMKLITDRDNSSYTTMGDWAQDWLVAAGAGGAVGSVTDTEKYILDPDNVVFANTLYYDLSKVPLANFTERLGILLNTFWQMGFAPMFTANDLESNVTNTEVIINNVDGTKSVATTTYTVRWGWLAVLLLCSVFLLVAGVAAVIWDTMSISPDILGFASSVARRSKYVDLPKVDTAAGGAERARLLGQVRVMMQDVRPKAEVGRIALGTVHAKAERLQAGRMYR